MKKEFSKPPIEIKDNLDIELTTREIELFEKKSNLIKEVKGKEILSSPSLEDLNNKATES
jgi:hypothetical protein